MQLFHFDIGIRVLNLHLVRKKKATLFSTIIFVSHGEFLYFYRWKQE